MSIQTGQTFPQGSLLRVGEKGPESVSTAELAEGRVALFGLPGAFTGTCTNAHMPSFVRTAPKFREKGIDRIVCLTVNDPFVAKAWSDATGAAEAGIEVLADADGSVTKALGLDFDAPPAGFYGRCKRFAALLRDGNVEAIDIEDAPGQCSVSAGESLLEKV
ncbi:MAG: peroxiredoxin [Paracoccus sp. (in: a-proteobacteria)]|jgi:cytochrome c peroxidase|uniref:peroxiredoxin n=1 Tax=unclassified Paracoccus (in: a-proteobacteria) TaxID=2688777 RepID=UPI000C545086|nr:MULTISPECIES: peroxiredoxin [unclassified Paracoccus (in: a-proteobacteria)]MAN56075.1 peroxiredoxin [Paracoccus sp. (in: a-proteobacteria)]MBA50457.1 peroxiredoxin [Paracoccus sp. (in: a-proteobacteria)]MCS5602257.1 peroxiredoxin [Paracoccus sp. (in: a-proteobacteria)]|tara:strand:- start:532 stop:1017 length:486 start_codon:yes stop_codon:yes gene_type:complete